MPSTRNTLATVVGLGALVLGSPLCVDAQVAPVGFVTRLDGTATLRRVNLPGDTPLKPRDPVFVADRITTGDESTARILLGGKALVTVRERTVVTIKEAAGVSTVNVGLGRMGIAVVKERMNPGELIEIRTPNAVAAIRGTVVITEVSPATSQRGATPGGFTTNITVIRGLVELHQLDATTHQRQGVPVWLGPLQTIQLAGGAVLPAPKQITPESAQRLVDDMKVRTEEVPAASAPVIQSQVQEAATAVAAMVDAQQGATTTALADTGASSTVRAGDGSAAGADGSQASTTGATASTGSGASSTPSGSTAAALPAAVSGLGGAPSAPATSSAPSVTPVTAPAAPAAPPVTLSASPAAVRVTPAAPAVVAVTIPTTVVTGPPAASASLPAAVLSSAGVETGRPDLKVVPNASLKAIGKGPSR
jgi:hypothetical protein